MKQLLIRADDLGFSEATNYGIFKTVKDGIIRSVGLMPNMPSAQMGYDLIDVLGSIDVEVVTGSTRTSATAGL